MADDDKRRPEEAAAELVAKHSALQGERDALATRVAKAEPACDEWQSRAVQAGEERDEALARHGRLAGEKSELEERYHSLAALLTQIRALAAEK